MRKGHALPRHADFTGEGMHVIILQCQKTRFHPKIHLRF